jgi:hypothetical protein
MSVEVYFRDLNKRLQNAVLKYYKVKTPEDKKFEYVPLFVLKDGPDEAKPNNGGPATGG